LKTVEIQKSAANAICEWYLFKFPTVFQRFSAWFSSLKFNFFTGSLFDTRKTSFNEKIYTNRHVYKDEKLFLHKNDVLSIYSRSKSNYQLFTTFVTNLFVFGDGELAISSATPRRKMSLT
jgi:hypothetical protein